MNGGNAKYEILTRILDRIVGEGAKIGRLSIYKKADASDEARDQARARAYIHLFLESKFGIYEFAKREGQITESSYDGGIDAYHIDHDLRKIFLIQSKFRNGAKNFSEKTIGIGEITRIDADRILEGETHDSAGNKYSGHIDGLQRAITAIDDITPYTFSVIILANVHPDHLAAVERLFPKFNTEIYNFERCYGELVLPILRGEPTYLSNLRFNIDMSNKSDGSKLSAKVITKHGAVEVHVILAPTIEIARLMSRYRNSILRYNPRSYLELRHQATNQDIRDSILERATGEFALFNNGITLISNETRVSEMTGKKNSAQVSLLNPQIINGGQTAFTLSRIYDAHADADRLRLFADKEVVVRIITIPSEIDLEDRLDLIREISSATNSQTQVQSADRIVSNDNQRDVAERVFLNHGILYEHKRGEYAEAVHNGLIKSTSIVDRALFLRLMLLASGQHDKAGRVGATKRGKSFVHLVVDDETVKRFVKLLAIYRELTRRVAPVRSKIALTLAMVDAVDAAQEMYLLPSDASVIYCVQRIEEIWPDILEWCLSQHHNMRLTGVRWSDTTRAAEDWARSRKYPNDTRAYLTQFGLDRPLQVCMVPEVQPLILDSDNT